MKTKQQLHYVQGYGNERFTIERTEELDGLPHLKKLAEEHGKEPVHYVMKRYTEGTRKKSYCIYALRFKKSGRFISAY